MYNYPPKVMDPYTVNETDAAKFIGVSKKTLQTWRSRRIGPPYVKMGRKCIRYRMDDLKAFVDGRLVVV